MTWIWPYWYSRCLEDAGLAKARYTGAAIDYVRDIRSITLETMGTTEEAERKRFMYQNGGPYLGG